MVDTIPYKVTAFVCTNDRKGEKASCADGDAVALREALKRALKEKGWWGRVVRVSSSGCLGLCGKGPNVVIFPEGEVISKATLSDVKTIMGKIAAIVESQ